MFVAGGITFALLIVSSVHADLDPVDKEAVFKAAGFKKAQDGRYIRCEEETPTASYTPGQIELVDLNGDGQPEAWVTESSMFCYGSPHTFFSLVRKDAGSWRKLLDDVGIPVVLKTKHHGWPDIEVGGPEFGKFPYYRWNGKSYVRVTPKKK
jgi:hypothetical protein